MFLESSLELNTPDETIFYSMGLNEETHKISTPSINLSFLPHLQCLTIHGAVFHVELDNPYCPDNYCLVSHLPAVVAIFKTASPLQHLTIDIDLDLNVGFFSKVNFPFFTALAEYAASFCHINLYIQDMSDTCIVSLFGEYGGVMALIERGVLVIHWCETALRDP